ncbi:hypothetical protein G6F65_019229 [Rhizopus arrhizus]|nr:hypothetical protein G6F65_019229 [Rhizopus arrhizus]
MVAYAYDMIARKNPMGFFGMVHVLEGTSVALALNAADQIQQKLALPASAFSYLRSHGTLDQEHTAHFAELMNRLDDAGDQAAVVHAANMFFGLRGCMSPRDASIVLTGAAGGLGSAIARQFFAEGARLLLIGRTAGPLLSLAQSLSAGAQDRNRVDALVVDVTTDHGRAAIIDAAAARNANVLINNAAVAARDVAVTA